MQNKIMVGVPVSNDLESLKLMLESLIASTSAFKTIYIVESGSDEKTLKWLEQVKKWYSCIEIVHTPKEGPLKAYNQIFKEARDRKMDLLLTQTDVVFPKLYKRDWLSIMQYVSENEKIGAVTCLNGGGKSGDTYINGFKWIGGWCTYIPLRTNELIGGYDETYPNGFGVDIDYTYAILSKELNICEINYWVDHHMQNERNHDIDPETEKRKEESAKYFKQKWKL